MAGKVAFMVKFLSVAAVVVCVFQAIHVELIRNQVRLFLAATRSVNEAEKESIHRDDLKNIFHTTDDLNDLQLPNKVIKSQKPHDLNDLQPPHYHNDHQPPHDHNDHQPPHDHQRPHQYPKNIFVLSSAGRSGSSLLGSLVASLGRAMYIFEPLRTLRNIRESDECGPFYSENRRTSEAIRMAGQVCNRVPVKIIKTIRCRLQWISELLQDTNIDMKVIHLVRDPRGTMMSMYKTKFPDVSQKNLCPGLRQDLQHKQFMMERFPGRYMFIKYEDLCQDPYGKTSEIFRFLKGEGKVSRSTNSSSSASPSQDIPRCVQEFLHTHMHNAKGNPYSTYRNTATTWQKWRSSISQKSLMTWERECSDVLHMMGHRIFGSVDNARNLSLSLFVGA
ncbi:carbohydrate sulfotransferase 3-like isoform X2 [Homarus americanus]|uniref:carbohydrate sulfotransferase 3-like isoform X2 n=1 Tax=Homarus americanus TaxID=6706 RepID=UPI001C43FB86|nr:carbohydrate sulfotransferase 3-like isoform X2 [Homarus americanus]